MKLVFVSPVGVIGGAERVLLHLFESLAERLPEHRRMLIQLGDGPLAEAATKLGVEVDVEPPPESFAAIGETQLRNGAPRWRAKFAFHLGRAGPEVYRLVLRLRRKLKALRPAVVYSSGMKAHFLARVATPRGTPRIVHLHDFFSQRLLARRALPFLAKGVARGIAVSNAVAEDVRRIVPSLPMTVVLNAVDTDRFSPGPAAGRELDRAAGLPLAAEGVLRVGLVATYANWKGHFVFLEALAKIPEVRGFIVGGPIYTTSGSQVTLDELKAAARSLGVEDRVGFLPFQYELEGVYRRLDVVVHASTRPEPFGLTIAEAMSVGKPVVVAAAGGALELFDDGEDALGHTPGDADSLAGQLTRLVRDPGLRLKLGENGRHTAVERFHRQRFAEEISDVFRDVLCQSAACRRCPSH